MACFNCFVVKYFWVLLNKCIFTPGEELCLWAVDFEVVCVLVVCL